jgi:hypothetical protein
MDKDFCIRMEVKDGLYRSPCLPTGEVRRIKNEVEFALNILTVQICTLTLQRDSTKDVSCIVVVVVLLQPIPKGRAEAISVMTPRIWAHISRQISESPIPASLFIDTMKYL